MIANTHTCHIKLAPSCSNRYLLSQLGLVELLVVSVTLGHLQPLYKRLS